MRPRFITLFFLLCIGLLGVLCLVWPKEDFHIGGLELRWPTIAEALDLPSAEVADSIYEENDTLFTLPADTISESIAGVAIDTISVSSETMPIQAPSVSVDSVVDTRYYLRTFYQALDEADRTIVRVIHYGDSQIEEDRMTQTLRRNLQGLYGGGGVGLIPLHQTIPTRTLHQMLTMNGHVQSVQQGPRRNLVYGPKSQRRTDGRYGMMGQVALMDDSILSGSEQLSLQVEPMSNKAYSERFFNRLRMFCDGDIRLISEQGDTLPASRTLHLPDSTTHYTLKIEGRGAVYGLSLETPTGVIVDNVPMRGCLGTVFTSISHAQLSQFYHSTNTRLIILQFGGNAIPFNENPSTIRGIVQQLRQQVEYLRSCAPEASFLFIGPGDMTTLTDGQPATYPLLPYMDKLLLRMAQEEHIAYYSLYQAMGGRNSMVGWQQRGLAGSDGVHFTRRGAEVAAQRLWDYLYEGLQLYKTTPSDTIQ